ncbi:sigma factor-like helix-turn-helix DNA-binding protein [Mesorhizobium sp.]|uniref:sigma factor-like helix-turn-helix DNA-binding protein n=1 Tax=Mesorhizobium sp. TaxID=1871066 RepID=UPI003423A0D8
MSRKPLAPLKRTYLVRNTVIPKHCDKIKGLPTGQRQAIELLKLREMSLKEAASFTGMSIAALKVATHRGMTALRMLLVTEG